MLELKNRIGAILIPFVVGLTIVCLIFVLAVQIIELLRYLRVGE